MADYKLSYTGDQVEEKLSILPQKTSTKTLPIKEYEFKRINVTDDYVSYKTSFIYDKDKYLPLSTSIQYKIKIDKTEYSDFDFSRFGTRTEGYGFGNEYLWGLWVENHDDQYWDTTIPEDDSNDICLFYNCGNYYDGEMRTGELFLLIRNLTKPPKTLNVSVECSIKEQNSILFQYEGGNSYSRESYYGNEIYTYFYAPDTGLKSLPDNTELTFVVDGVSHTGLWHTYDFGYGPNGWLGNVALSSDYFDGTETPLHLKSDEDFFVGFGSHGSYTESYIDLDMVTLPNNQNIRKDSEVSLIINNFSTITKIDPKFIDADPTVRIDPASFTIGVNAQAPMNDGYSSVAIGNNSYATDCGLAIGNNTYAEESCVFGTCVGGINNSIVISSNELDSEYEYTVDKDLGILYLNIDYYPDFEGLWGIILTFNKDNYNLEALSKLYEEEYDYWEVANLVNSGSFTLTVPLEGIALSSQMAITSENVENDDNFAQLISILKKKGACQAKGIVANNGIVFGDGYAENGVAIQGQALGYGGSYDDNKNAVAILGSASGCNDYGSYAIAICGEAEGEKTIALGGEAIGDGNIAIGSSLTTGNDSVLLTTHTPEDESYFYYNIQDLKLNHKYLPVRLTQQPKYLNTYGRQLYYCYISGGWNIYVYSGNDRSHQIDEVFYETAPEGFPGSYTSIWMYFYEDSDGQYYGQIVTPKIDTVEVTTSSSEQASKLSVGAYYTLRSEGLVQVIKKLDDLTIVLQPIQLGTNYFYDSYAYNFYIPTNTANRTRNFGYGTSTNNDYQTVIGKYNKMDENALFVIGNGEDHSERNNAFTIDEQGNALVSGQVVANSFRSRQIGQNYLSIKDSVTDDEYAIQVRNGEFLFTLIPVSIEINTLPNKIEYMEGESLDLTGLSIKAIFNNGNETILEDYKVLSKTNTLLKEDSTVLLQVDTPIPFEIEFQISIIDFDTEILKDFTYKKTSEGYVLTGWNKTFNGEPSTEMIIPDNGLIIV